VQRNRDAPFYLNLVFALNNQLVEQIRPFEAFFRCFKSQIFDPGRIQQIAILFKVFFLDTKKTFFIKIHGKIHGLKVVKNAQGTPMG